MPVRAAIALLRPVNGLITLSSVLLAAWLAVDSLPSQAFLAAFAASLIASFGNAHNDLIDLEIDRQAHPERALPSRRLSPRAAMRLAWACALVGCALTLLLPPPCPLLAVANTFFLWGYNRWAKWWPFFGNALIAAIAASTFLFGGLAVGTVEGLIAITCFAFLLHLSREIVKDIQDLEPDAQAEGSTLPAAWGVNPSRWVATGLLVALMALAPLPALMGLYGWPYLVAIGVLDVLLIGTLYQLWIGNSADRYGRVSGLLKIGMLVGLAAFLVVRL